MEKKNKRILWDFWVRSGADHQNVGPLLLPMSYISYILIMEKNEPKDMLNLNFNHLVSD